MKRWQMLLLVSLSFVLASGVRMPDRSFFVPSNVGIDDNPTERVRAL